MNCLAPRPSEIQIYYICTEIYYNIICQINITCWKLLAIWLVGEFSHEWKLSYDQSPIADENLLWWKKSHRFSRLSLSAFTKENSRVMASSSATSRFADIVSVEEFISRRTGKLKQKRENWAEYCSAEGIFDAKRRGKSCRRNFPRRSQFIHQRIHYNSEKERRQRKLWAQFIAWLDCKAVRIFAYSSTREQSNKRCGTRLKTESETTPYGRVRLARFARIRLLRHALPISLLILRKKPTVLQSIAWYVGQL